jgi:hypothetical protein
MEDLNSENDNNAERKTIVFDNDIWTLKYMQR